MKKKFLIIVTFFMVLMVCFVPNRVSAAGSKSIKTVSTARQTKRKLGWVKENGKWYFYRATGKIAKGWVAYRHKWYYTDKRTGERITGWYMVGGKMRYFRKAGGYLIRNGLWRLDGKLYYFLQGTKRAEDGILLCNDWQTVNGRDYYFGDDGAAISGFHTLDGTTYYFRAKYCFKAKGWLTIRKKRYHFNTSDLNRPVGAMDTGLVTIDGSQYFFNDDGSQITDDFDANGKHYSFDANGRCTVTDITSTEDPSISNNGSGSGSGDGLSEDFLFFTVYESGSSADFYAGYNQTGGDNGNACGKYQFDYRYSLLPFVRDFCYRKDPVFFKEFAPFAALSNLQKSKLRGNKEFYEAWHTIFNKNKVKFANYQDAYAKQEYYDLTEYYLKNTVNLKNRPDVIKGAIFSYSIQHGQLTAANAVIAAKITDATSDEEFLTKLYNYRIRKFPAYASRYRSEKSEALSRLRRAA